MKAKVFELITRLENGFKFQRWECIKSGKVVGETTTHVRVFNAQTDVNPGTAEWFPRQAKLLRTEVTP